MLKTRDEIAEIYQKAYPNLEDHYCILLSEEFLLPTSEQVKDWIAKYSVAHIPHVKNIADCEKRAWFLINSIHRERAENALNIPEDERYTVSIGWLTGLKKNIFGESSHTIVTVLTEDGIVNIEPKTDLIEEVDINKFDALLLVM
jgi:hypothetical protein